MDVAEQFSLCWNNFHNNLSSGIHSLLLDQDLVDVTLAAEGKLLKAHKAVLSVCSPFFKELFRLNPCKHPIVILPDVSYSTLKHLLHFMYQGEVSVSHDEIPSFMRVAQTLKVKGLTENSDTNSCPFKPNDCTQRKEEIVKRPRTAKKLIRPLQPLRPLDTSTTAIIPPSASSPSLPSLKRPYIEHPDPDHQDITNTSSQNDALSLVKPKEEYMENDTSLTHSCMEEMQADLATMLDTQLNAASCGEASSSYQVPSCWPIGAPPVIKEDSSQSSQSENTGDLCIIKSGKGQLVLIHEGHMYTFVDHIEKSVSLWICVKKRMLNCGGCITTNHGQVLSFIGHNHPQIHDVIQRLQLSKASPT